MIITVSIAILLLLGSVVAALMSPAARAGLARTIREPAFVCAAIVLIVAAVGLNSATQFLELHFRKQPVALRHAVTDISPVLGHWVQVSRDEPLMAEIEDTLGTKMYVFRDYVDTRHVGENVLDSFRDRSATERKGLVARLAAQQPHAVMHFAITYYTGMVDTVAHVPDRCYIAGGYEPAGWEVLTFNAFPQLSGPERMIEARLIAFEDQTASRAAQRQNVVYFFRANGRYESDPLGVRKTLQDLRQRYGYYAKVELMNTMPVRNPADRQLVLDQMEDFIQQVLPEVERCLPDWNAVTARASQ
jgi:hypothetical protein